MTAAVLDLVKERLAPGIGEASFSHGMLVVKLTPDVLLATVQRLKSEFEFDLFLDVTAVDWPGQVPRFEIVYHFYSTQHRVRVRLKTRVPLEDPAVDSLTPLYGSAHFMERECHDMYGIVFRNNPDQRPILLYEGFIGHPLRKDYPIRQEQPLVRFRN